MNTRNVSIIVRGFPPVTLTLVLGIIVLTFFSFDVTASGGHIWVPVRWCGVAGAESMDNPGAVGEATSDDVLWRRHERPTDSLYIPLVNMTFRAGSTAAIANGPQSFPIIRDPSGTGGDLLGSGENSDAITMCRRAWVMGDPLYFDQNNNAVVNQTQDTLLSTSSATPTVGFVEFGHNGAPLVAVPSNVKFADSNSNGSFDIGERIYRDENTNNVVENGDTLLVATSGTVVGAINPADSGRPLVALPSQVKYVDLIRAPASTFNIGYPAVQGITSVNANDVEFPGLGFPVHGVAASGIGGLGVAVDDASQYLPPGPDFTLFEIQLVGHEFAHAFSLQHGDGVDDDMDTFLDDGDDPTAPFPGAGPGTLCDSNNVMQYCWQDHGTSGNPNMNFIGIGTATSGTFTTLQSDKIRNHVLSTVSDRIVDPVDAPLVAARVDNIGDVEEGFEYIDIAEFSVMLDSSRKATIFTAATRRPFPDDLDSTIDFYFLLDMDENPETGGAFADVADTDELTDFTGAEYISTVRFRGLEVESVSLFQYDLEKQEFSLVDADRILTVRNTLNAIPDFPFGQIIEGPELEVISDFPIQESIMVIMPSELLSLSADSHFRVEYIVHEVDANIVDSASSWGMNFDLPVFPECRTEPEYVAPGANTTVIASGMLPDRDVHLLLGPDEVASGHTDAEGSVTISMPIPSDTRLGLHLVTVGALAVSADCLVNVTTEKPPDGGTGEPTNGTCNCGPLSLQLWIVIGLLLIALIILLLLIIFVLLRRVSRNRTGS